MTRFAVSLTAIALLAVVWLPAAARADLGFLPGDEGFSVTATKLNGTSANGAGTSPYALTTEIGFQPGGGDARDLYLELPPGLIENPNAIAKCTQAAFHTPRSSPYESPTYKSRSGEDCPDASQIGVVDVHTSAAAGGVRRFGVFNLVPPPGSPSQFGFAPFGAPIVFTPHIRQGDGEYGLTLVSRNLTQLFDLRGIELKIWGGPWASSHDGERGDCLNEAEPAFPFASCIPTASEKGARSGIYLTLPTSCAAPPAYALLADSWEQPGGYLPDGEPNRADPAWKSAQFSASAGLEGCGALSAAALVSALPSAETVSSPTGLKVQLEGSQAGIKKAVLALPAGLTINPSVGAGLGACTPAQYAAETAFSAPGAACPNPSKIGTVTLESTLLEEPLKGSLFIAKPYENPFGSAYALYFVARASERGFLVKFAGRLDADPQTGRLTATFDNLPRLPYSHLKIDFREGQRAPLVSPPSCGTYATDVALSPWTDPAAVSHQISSFKISRGLGTGGSCPSGGASPFAPHAVAGTINSNAGSNTSFYLHLTRSDAEQELTSYSAALPPGVLGTIASIPFCPDAAIEVAKGRRGLAEAASPSCPAASEIGHTYSGYGAGLAPAYSAGRFYLAGPYHGAPLSVVAINPAVVGPFDLGTIVIRSAIQVDPHTARVTIDSAGSDPIPHIFAGIPLRLRDVRVHIGRPGFMRNPTSCAPFSIASTLTGSDAPFANPRSATATATVPFQAFNCSSLGFRPGFQIHLKGAVKRGDYPTLRVTVTPRADDANIAAAAVTLPNSIFLAQEHVGGICTRVQFEADACPPRSVVGAVSAETPLLEEPMWGEVYLRSSDNLLPGLVATLRGRGVRIDLAGRVDSHRGGIRARFEGLPDAPVTKFTMTIFGGKKRGLLQAAEDLCRKSQIVDARLLGQANLGAVLKPAISARCPGKRRRG